jgi:branched-chain amino acid transport system ATP-binding protein
MGRNGMGKTTLIKSLLGLTPVRAGEIRIAGQSMRGAAPYRIARAGVGYVPEGRGIFPTLSVIENLQMAARPGVDGRRDWTLERVLQTFPRLAERRAHGGTQLSGGEQQMLSIGRALMTHPDVLFLDEATEGLAPLIVAEIWQIISRIRASGIATVVVDKNFRSVLKHTDRAVVMVKGQVALESVSSSLLDNPAQLSTLLGV